MSIQGLWELLEGKALPALIVIVLLGVFFFSLDFSLKLRLRFRGRFRSRKGELPEPCPLGGGENDEV